WGRGGGAAEGGGGGGRVEPLPLRGHRARLAVLDDDHAIDDAEVRHERSVERRRPADLARHDLRQLLWAERRQRERDRREVWARVERAAELLEQQRLV